MSWGKKCSGGLVPVFVCGCFVRSVKPPVRPCVEGRCEDECGKGEAVCGESDDEDEEDSVHGFVSLFLVFSS